MSELPPIPIPLRKRLRDFRVKFGPPLAFACVLVGISFYWGDSVQPLTLVGPVQTVGASAARCLVTNVSLPAQPAAGTAHAHLGVDPGHPILGAGGAN